MNSNKTDKKLTLIDYIIADKRVSITIPLMAVILSLVVGGLIILSQGKNPFQVYMSLLQGSGLLPKATYAAHKNMLSDFTSFLNAWTPMLFASLAVAVAMKAGLFNIGVAGQMLTSAFIASITIGYSPLPGILAKPLVVIVGIAVGMLLGALIGFLKYKFNINEVVSTIMVNYSAMYIISFAINTYYVNPVSRQSALISTASRLTYMNMRIGDIKVELPLGIILALLAAFALHFVLNHTIFGWDIKSVGLSRKAARYAGVNVARSMIYAMAISGALAGLAGVTYYLGYYASIQPRVLVGTGFDCIAVSLLADSNPIGIIGFSFLITILSKGSTYMNSVSGLEAEIAAVITSVILLFSAANVYIRYLLQKAKNNILEQSKTEEGKN